MHGVWRGVVTFAAPFIVGGSVPFAVPSVLIQCDLWLLATFESWISIESYGYIWMYST
jgi:hypothetical protein